MKKIFTAVNSVSTSVLKRKISFEEATEVSTPRLTVHLSSSSPSNVGGDVRAGFANFKLPNGNGIFSRGNPGLTSVNQKVSCVKSLFVLAIIVEDKSEVD